MPHPLAVGVLCLPGALVDRRRRAKLQIALRAHVEGYALLETVDASAPLIGMDGAIEALAQLSRQHDVRAVLVLGGVDTAGMDAVAREHHLVTVTVPEHRT